MAVTVPEIMAEETAIVRGKAIQTIVPETTITTIIVRNRETIITVPETMVASITVRGAAPTVQAGE